MNTPTATKVFIIGGLLLLLVSPLVFVLVAMSSGMSASETAAAVVDQYRSDRVNLLVSGLLSFFPMLLLAVILGIARRFSMKPENTVIYALGGVLPIVLVSIFVNFEYWPAFLPERVYPGFPHGLEFVIGPLAFAPAGMLLGLVIAWASLRKKTA